MFRSIVQSLLMMQMSHICITCGSRVPESRFSQRTPSQTRPKPPGDAQNQNVDSVLRGRNHYSPTAHARPARQGGPVRLGSCPILGSGTSVPLFPPVQPRETSLTKPRKYCLSTPSPFIPRAHFPGATRLACSGDVPPVCGYKPNHPVQLESVRIWRPLPMPNPSPTLRNHAKSRLTML